MEYKKPFRVQREACGVQRFPVCRFLFPVSRLPFHDSRFTIADSRKGFIIDDNGIKQRQYTIGVLR
jgi:hypothetical protein